MENPNNQLPRREFLKSLGVGSAAMLLPYGILQDGTDPAPAPPPPVTHWDGSPFGRVLLNFLSIYDAPDWRANYVSGVYYNDIIPVYQAVGGNGLYSNNHTWLQTDGGWVYSSWVQPAWDIPTNPIVPIGEGGAWGQVTVPISIARSGPTDDSYMRHRAYYSQVQRILGVENDYYLCGEIYGGSYYLKAAHVRIVPPEEVAPINAHVPPELKRIDILIRDQLLVCYEADVPVFSATVSTGTTSSPTSFGTYNVRDKRHGQRMTGGLTGGGYNLPGIPWVCYFTASYIATHGCYWHNDYGRRHSNGCVNLHPDAAKWVFRWTTPYANYWDYRTLPNAEAGQPGTQVVVKWA